MGEDELFLRFKNNEIEAQKIYFHKYGKEIAHFIFRCGLTTTDTSEAAVRTFRQLLQQLPTIESEQFLQKKLYKMAIQQMEMYELSTIDEFTFPEDQLLHNEIIELPHLEKITFIFMMYSDLKVEAIASILSLSTDEVLLKKSAALSKLTGTQIEKRLELLGKSYKRMRFPINEEAIFQLEDKEEVVEVPSFKSSKRNLYLFLTGVLMLIGLICYSVLTSESFQQTRFEKSLEKKKETYEQRRAEVLNNLGLTEEEIESYGFYGFFDRSYLSKEEKQRFDRFIKGIERDLERENEIDRKALEEEYSEFIEGLQTPSELAVDLLKKPLTDDLEASEKFLEDYIQKYTMVNNYYASSINNEQEIMQNMFVTEYEYRSLATVINELDELPKNVKVKIDKMAGQNMYFIDLSEEADRKRESFFQEVKEALHPDVGGYITMLSTTNPGEFFWGEVDEPIGFDYIKEIEATLMKTNMSEETRQFLEYRFITAISELLGNAADDIYDANGLVREEYRNKWQSFIDADETPITNVILKKVIQEFKETGWRISETQIYLDTNQIWEVLNFALRGNNLASFEWLNIEDADYQSVSLPNRGYQYILDEVYPKIEEDRKFLNGHPRMIVISAYIRALDQEDMDVLTILSADNLDYAELEKHMEQWKEQDFNEQMMRQISVYGEENQAQFSGEQVNGSFYLIMEDGNWVIQSYQFESH